MKTIKYREWELIVDSELTKLTYDNVAVGSSESCNCNDCRNFANNREEIYPDEIKKLLNELGIDYKKESEICHYCRQDDGFHFMAAGFILKDSLTVKTVLFRQLQMAIPLN